MKNRFFYTLLSLLQIRILAYTVYEDIFTGDKLLTDTFPIKVVDDILYEVQGRKFRILPSEERNFKYYGKTSISSYCSYENCSNYTVLGINVVLQIGLIQTDFFNDIKNFKFYLSTYIERLKYKLLKTKATAEAEIFRKRASEVYEKLMNRHSNFSYYIGQSFSHYKGMVVLMENRSSDHKYEDTDHIFIYFKHGLKEKKLKLY